MAQNVTIAGASYTDVPGVNLPKTAGGNALFLDSDDFYNKTEANQLLEGKVDTSDIQTTLSAQSTDSQVPSAKAVYDYVNTALGVIENGSY